ncbi:MAG: DUF333 domain-containing protein [Candidatus Altiarchaeota archaeon]
MRTHAALLMAVILCGCLGGGPQALTSTTSLAAFGGKESAIVAVEYVRGLDGYASSGCRGVRVNETVRLDCQGCFEVTLYFECATGEAGTVFEGRKATVTLENGKVTDIRESSEGVICTFDSDCMPERPVLGVRYVCEGGVCSAKPFGNPASQYCLDRGNHLVARTNSNGGTYGACIFENGNECDEWAYYYGRCDWNTSNLTDCSGYFGSQVCVTDYNPVCAKIVSSDNVSNFEWMTYSNQCTACAASTRIRTMAGYMMGECPPVTTTTLKSIVTNAAAEYCEGGGYAYRIRLYPSGKEYGVCVFGVEDECDAEDFFHGKCKPRF